MNFLDKIRQAESFERDLQQREQEAARRWLVFWQWLIVITVCLAAFALGLLIGLTIVRMLP